MCRSARRSHVSELRSAERVRRVPLAGVRRGFGAIVYIEAGGKIGEGQAREVWDLFQFLDYVYESCITLQL